MYISLIDIGWGSWENMVDDLKKNYPPPCWHKNKINHPSSAKYVSPLPSSYFICPNSIGFFSIKTALFASEAWNKIQFPLQGLKNITPW